MYKYAREFPVKSIPHRTEFNEIIDTIHNYKRPKNKEVHNESIDMPNSPEQSTTGGETKKAETNDFTLKKEPKNNLALDAAAPPLTDEMINDAKDEITSNETAKLIGLIVHLAYWSVYGHLNPMPLDKYHIKQLFISICQIQQAYESKYVGQKVFVSFIMPMIVLAIRIEVELIFKNSFRVFFSKAQHSEVSTPIL